MGTNTMSYEKLAYDASSDTIYALGSQYNTYNAVGSFTMLDHRIRATDGLTLRNTATYSPSFQNVAALIMNGATPLAGIRAYMSLYKGAVAKLSVAPVSNASSFSQEILLSKTNVTCETNGVAVDSTGAIIMAGEYTPNQYKVNREILLVKFNAALSSITWQKIVSLAGEQYAKGVVVDSSDNIYMLGHNSTVSYLLKYDSTGAVQWLKTFSSTYLQANSILYANNSIIIAGVAYDAAGNRSGFFVSALDTSGTVLWQKTCNIVLKDIGISGLAVDANNNIYATGTTNNDVTGTYDLVAVKFDSSGNLQWARLLGGLFDETGLSICIAGDYFVLSGSTKSQSSNTLTEGIIVKLPIDGSLTGTYGNYTYKSTTLTVVPGTIAVATTTPAATSTAYTIATEATDGPHNEYVQSTLDAVIA